MTSNHKVLFNTPQGKKKYVKQALDIREQLAIYNIHNSNNSYVTNQVNKIVELLTKKEVIEMPQEVIDFIDNHPNANISSLLSEARHRLHGRAANPKIAKYLESSRDNQIKFVKAWTGECELVAENNGYGIAIDNGKSYLNSFSVANGEYVRSFCKNPKVIFYDEESAKTLKDMLCAVYGEEHTVVPL